MNPPSSPPPSHPVRLRLVKNHRLVISIDSPAIDQVDVIPGRSGRSVTDLKAQVVDMDDELRTQLTQSGVKVIQPSFFDSPPPSLPLDYFSPRLYEESYTSNYNRYPSTLPPTLESAAAPPVHRSTSPAGLRDVREGCTLGSHAEIEFKAGLYAHISEFCAARQYPVPFEVARATIRCKPEKVALVTG
ncbi:unnamed protein product [Peniophora sp. CBMAI 1063]|nr:unnamed protein product [Peniophora sp. CBMAI 1063]